MRKQSTESRFAERELHGFDEVGSEERILVWIERQPGSLWAVGRAVNPQIADVKRKLEKLDGHQFRDGRHEIRVRNDSLVDRKVRGDAVDLSAM